MPATDVFMWNRQQETMPRSELRALQGQRLNEQVNRCLAHVPFYKKVYAEHGMTADKVDTIEDLRKLPFTTKSDLRDYYPLGILSVDRSQLRRVHASSGTRGKPTISAYTAQDIELWADLCARALAACGVKPGDVVHNAYGYGLFTGGLGIHYGAERLGAVVVPASGGRTQQQIALLNDFRANVLCCTPSYAMNIALSLAESKLSLHHLNLSVGIFGAEPWTESLRREIERHLGITALDIYGLSEVIGPGIAVECAQARRGLHIWEDHFAVEIVDPESLEPLPEGCEGELVLTTLTREAMSLIRYRTGDITSLTTEPCECGRTSARINRIRGRLDDMLIIRGVNVYPSEIEAVLLDTSGASTQYQLVISREKALDELKVRVELDSSQDGAVSAPALVAQLIGALKNNLGLAASVEVLPANTLPRSEGKALRVLDMRE